MATLLFVHGTGVRQTAYDRAFAVVSNSAQRHRLRVDVQSCLWGESVGVQPPNQLTSVPGHQGSSGSEATSEVRWSILYDDPLYELRTHAALAAIDLGNELGGNDRSGRQPAPIQQVLTRLEGLLPSHGGIARSGHLAVDLIGPALKLLQADGILEAALLAPSLQDPARARPIMARAFVAAWAQSAESFSLPALDGDLRDSLYLDAVTALGGATKGIKDELMAALVGLGARLLTPALRGSRGQVTNAHLTSTNDVLLYQTQRGGAAIRGFIAQRIQMCEPPVYILAHSLGGIACAELLSERVDLGVERLITCGSQTSFLAESDALALIRRGKELPKSFPPWLNVFDRNDLLSYPAAGVFGDSVKDFEVCSRQPFPASHSAYWAQDSLWTAVKEFVA